MSTQAPHRTTVVVGSSVGLHARPAALIAQAVRAVDAAVRLGRPGGKLVDAASPLLIISLGARCGEEIVVEADGAQAAEALRQVSDLVAQDLDADAPDA